MIEVAGRYGYAGASVARVVRAAGVSRATFYESFCDREDCFRAVAQRLTAEVARRVESLEKVGPVGALGEALEVAERHPASTRVLMLELLGAPLPARAEYERLLGALAAAISADSERWFDDGSHLELPARALLGGVGGVIAIRSFCGEADQLRGMATDLFAWVESYLLAGTPGDQPLDWRNAGVRLRSELPLPPPLGAALDEHSLPRGSGATAPSLVAERQRTRVFAAMARLCRARGYAEIRVQDLVAAASITREAFYRHFRSKEDAFLATQAFALEQSVAFSTGRFFSEESWPDRVWSGLEATLIYIASQPDLVYIDLVESYAAGPAAIRRSFENRMAFTFFLEQGFQQVSPGFAHPESAPRRSPARSKSCCAARSSWAAASRSSRSCH